MSARQELNAYVTQLERRLRIGTLSRGTAIMVGAALGVTIVLAVGLSLFEFSDGSLSGARLVLFVALAIAAVFGLGIPFKRLTRRRVARTAEEVFPYFIFRRLRAMPRSARALRRSSRSRCPAASRSTTPRYVQSGGQRDGYDRIGRAGFPWAP